MRPVYPDVGSITQRHWVMHDIRSSTVPLEIKLHAYTFVYIYPRKVVNMRISKHG